MIINNEKTRFFLIEALFFNVVSKILVKFKRHFINIITSLFSVLSEILECLLKYWSFISYAVLGFGHNPSVGKVKYVIIKVT